MFVLSLALVSGLMLIKIANLEQIMFWLFIAGNVLYYILGIGLAFVLKDNRAFCKYFVSCYGISQAYELFFIFTCPLRRE